MGADVVVWLEADLGELCLGSWDKAERSALVTCGGASSAFLNDIELEPPAFWAMLR